MVAKSNFNALIAVIGINAGLFAKSWADELDNFSTQTADLRLSAQIQGEDLTDAALQCFQRLKSKGTVWLKTQRRVNELNASVDGSEGNLRVRALGEEILGDCELIENQQALEQARYLLTTLNTKLVDDSDIQAVQTMLTYADGVAALSLVEDLILQLSSQTR